MIVEETEIPELKISDILEADDMQTFKINVNNTEIHFENIKKIIRMNDFPVTVENVIPNNAVITYEVPAENCPIVSDIFKYYDPEKLLQEHHGGLLQITMNGEKAEFMTKLKNKAKVKIFYL